MQEALEKWAAARLADAQVAAAYGGQMLATRGLPAPDELQLAALLSTSALAVGVNLLLVLLVPRGRKFVLEAVESVLAVALIVVLVATVLGLPLGERRRGGRRRRAQLAGLPSAQASPGMRRCDAIGRAEDAGVLRAAGTAAAAPSVLPCLPALPEGCRCWLVPTACFPPNPLSPLPCSHHLLGTQGVCLPAQPAALHSCRGRADRVGEERGATMTLPRSLLLTAPLERCSSAAALMPHRFEAGAAPPASPVPLACGSAPIRPLAPLPRPLSSVRSLTHSSPHSLCPQLLQLSFPLSAPPLAPHFTVPALTLIVCFATIRGRLARFPCPRRAPWPRRPQFCTFVTMK